MPFHSSRPGTITDAQFDAALQRFNLGRFIAAEPTSTGLFGQNIFVTSTDGEWVLRGWPHFDWQFPKERFFARVLHEHGRVPVPWPYLHDAGTDIFGWSYVIMPRLSGVQTAVEDVWASLAPDDKRAIVSVLGRTLAEMHTLRWPHAGEYDLAIDDIVPLHGSWYEHVTSTARSFLALARGLSDRTSDDDVAWVEEILTSGRDAMQVDFVPTIVMGDYSRANTVAQRTSIGWRISGIFDLMNCRMGDGEADLSRQTAIFLDQDRSLAAAFLHSYIERQPMRPGFARRFPVYLIAERLEAWEYSQRNPGLWWDPKLKLQEWGERYIEESRALLPTECGGSL